MSSAQGLAYEVLDVFAEAPFAGNPVAVVRGAARLSGAEMQAIARETNLSETTFVLHDAPRDGAFDVRIFTPALELPYAGHPTLGTAFAIRVALPAPTPDAVVLRLGVGLVPVSFAPDGLVWLRAPRASFARGPGRELVAAALSLDAAALHPALPVEIAASGIRTLIVPLRDLAALRRARIEPAAYEKLRAEGGPAGLYPVARETRDPRNAWSVRLFAPADGVPEDPATGSAAGLLAAWLLRHRVHGAGDLEARLEQGHEIGRPSLLHVRAGRAGDEVSVSVGGRVIPVARGVWL